MASLRDRFASLGRDLASALGKRPPPVIARPTARRTYPTTTSSARPLVVREVRRETADGTVVVLADPTGAPIRFVPGQFLTLQVTIDGEVLRRAYSICSDVDVTDTVAICAKRIAGGRVSTYLHERLRAGDVVPVLGPSGEFTVAIDPAARRRLVLIAGGSGITPILAIVRAVLAHEPDSACTLVYGNRDAASTMFKAELDALAAAHPARFALHHVTMLDRDTLAAIVTDADADHYVCGPLAAMAEVRAHLAARGVAPARIHEERFATPEKTTRAHAAAPLAIRRRGAAIADVVVAPDATLLDAALAAGATLPFSCAMGGCGACAVQLVEGEVDLDEPNCLTAAERAAGKILTCVARPCGPVTIEAP